ncbi:MAG: ribonuclease HII [Novosphingobium sp. PASSN1]|nr:MAG: ribonuclease HII [Novosphingobium sp. PASSN1]
MPVQRPLVSAASASAENALALPEGLVVGVDEAGRGPLAGPVVAAAVVLGAAPPNGLGDSKKLSALRRARLEPLIQQTCHWALGVADVEEIDRLNIFAATMLAMTRAVSALVATLAEDRIGTVLIDGNLTPAGRCEGWIWPARAIVRGDASEPCISAASILAKEHRDRVMRAAAVEFPHYGWERNAGYGTAQHLAALQQYGASPHHRRSFAPVAAVVS